MTFAYNNSFYEVAIISQDIYEIEIQQNVNPVYNLLFILYIFLMLSSLSFNAITK